MCPMTHPGGVRDAHIKKHAMNLWREDHDETSNKRCSGILDCNSG
jgi:hypothetical protein